MDVIHRRGRATVGEIQKELEGEATYSAIRSALRLLRDKKVIRHEPYGKKYVYRAMMPRTEACESALKHLVETFFSGSQAATVSAILEMAETDLPDEELDRLDELISRASQQDAER